MTLATKAPQAVGYANPPIDGGELEFDLTKSGLTLSGTTQSKGELLEFLEKLKALALLLPESKPEESEDNDELKEFGLG